MKYTIVIALVGLLSGCGTMFSSTQIAKIPITTRCEPKVKVTEITEYAYDKATKEMSGEEKTSLALSELNAVKGQNVELKAALKECTK